MNPTEVTAQLAQALQSQGFRHKIVPIGHVEDIRRRIRDDVSSQRIADPIYQLYKKDFDFTLPDSIQSASSIIVVAAPQPIFEIVFHVGGKTVTVPIPPTYHHDTDTVVSQTLEHVLESGGWQFGRLSVPLKLLAVHSGLAKYGRNNIAYIDGMGSFFRLAAFWSDIPAIDDPWQGLEMVELCANCLACQRRCPTGAISLDRLQVRAERCLTYFTECPADFPDWVGDSWHHCLVGCMRCQTTCPLNKDVRSRTQIVAEFSGEETAKMLQTDVAPEIPAAMLDLARRIGLGEEAHVLIPRNLRKLIDKLPSDSQANTSVQADSFGSSHQNG